MNTNFNIFLLLLLRNTNNRPSWEFFKVSFYIHIYTLFTPKINNIKRKSIGKATLYSENKLIYFIENGK